LSWVGLFSKLKAPDFAGAFLRPRCLNRRTTRATGFDRHAAAVEKATIPLGCAGHDSYARTFLASGEFPGDYWQDARIWLVWGIVATVPLVAAVYVMIAKP